MWIRIMTRNDHQRALEYSTDSTFCIIYLWHGIACPLDYSHWVNMWCARIRHLSQDFWDRLYNLVQCRPLVIWPFWLILTYQAGWPQKRAQLGVQKVTMRSEYTGQSGPESPLIWHVKHKNQPRVWQDIFFIQAFSFPRNTSLLIIQ